MSASTDIVPSGKGSGGALRRSGAAGSNDDMPQALLEFHSPSAAIAAMPPSATARYINWIVCSMAAATVMGLSLYPIGRVVTATGALVPTVPTLVVQPFDTALIKSIDVREGDVVHKGQVLAHLDPTLTSADLGSMRDQTFSLSAEVDRLKAEVAGKDYVADSNNPASTQQAAIFLRRKAEITAKLQADDQQIISTKNELVGYQASADMYAGRVKVAADVHNMRMQLQRDQVGSRLNSLASQDELMEMERSQINAQQSAASTEGKLKALVAQRENDLETFRSDTYQQLTEAQRKLYTAQGEYEKAKLHRSLVVMRADRDAVVLNIARVSVGSVVTAAQQFMTLVPLDAPLEVEARMQADQSAYVKVGDHANIKFGAFPYVQHGGAQATVSNISADSFSQEAVQAGSASAPANGLATPGGDAKSFYRVRLRIDRYTLHDVPRFFKPVPGQQVTADIEVGKRTIMQFLLGSVMPTVSEGMRDPG